MSASLDEDQRAGVEALGVAVSNGSTAVLQAGAGSGKTHAMAYGISQHPGALGISHTNLACEAIRQRVERFSIAYDAHICTIHSIACRLTSHSVEDSVDPESGVDFDRMLERAIVALRDSEFALPSWLSSRRYLVVDEFQDTGSVQNTLIGLLRHRLSCALAVVGDFAQSIYGFQGATSEHMNNLRMRSDCVEVTLRSNYRSHPSIVAHANRLSHGSNGGIGGAIEMRATRFPRAGTREMPLHLRCYRSDVDLVKAVARWILHRARQGILVAGDALSLYPSKGEARDYAHRRLALSVVDGEPPPDGTVVVLQGEEGEACAPGKIRLSPGTVDRKDLSGVVVHNPRRRLLVACRNVAGRRQLLNQVYSNLITKERVDPSLIFITDRDNKPENDEGKQRMRDLGISLSTVHGAKGEEWDSVLHVDLGERLKRPTTHDDEEHRILYVSHTRAIDELWHVAVCAPNNMSLTRYVTENVAAHFRTEREEWEEDEGPPVVPPIFFDPKLVLPPELKDEGLSITEVADKTRTVWEPTKERPPVQEVVWEHTPKLQRLPKRLFSLNAAHGVFLEWVCLWHMHESATRQDILEFLTKILRNYSVNKPFAISMRRVFDDGSADEAMQVRDYFERLRLSEDDARVSVEGLHAIISAALDRVCAPDTRPALRLSDMQSAMSNVRMQQFVRLDSSPRRCPVRATIPHFDSHTGADSWKLDDVPGLKQRVMDACRAVFSRLSRANTADKFVCLLFMQSVQMLVGGKTEEIPDEHAWRILLTVLQDQRILGEYVEYINGQMELIRADSLALRQHVGVTEYQTPSELEVSVCHVDTDEGASYHLLGRADATSDESVLEVTSRDANYKNKVQQAHLYASILDKSEVYNYYIENRLLVRRTRIESASDFLQRSAEDLVMRRGLPGLREKIDRSNLVAEWSVRPHKRARDEHALPHRGGDSAADISIP
tara:strand:- start:249 stop:3095 length:2847 start_codon:yes stop_codon:yes gene_type:complete